MTAAWQTVAARSEALGTDLVISKPTGTVDGDLLIFVGVCGAGQTISKPDVSWTTAAFSLGGQAPCFYKIASGEGANWTFAVSGSVSSVGQVVRISGNHASSPVDDGDGAFATSGNLVVPSVDSAGASRLLMGLACKLTASATFTPPGTMTERYDTTTASQTVSYEGADETVGAGATGTRTWTPSAGTSPGVAYVLAIAPAAVNQTVTVPAAATATAEAKVPTVTSSSAPAAPAAQATAGAHAPVVTADANVQAPPATATAASPFGGIVASGGATLFPPAATATAEPAVPGVSASSTVAATRATAGAAALEPSVGASVAVQAVPATAAAEAFAAVVETVHIFDPPTQLQSTDDHFWGRFAIPVGVSVIKIDGTYVRVPTPTNDELVVAGDEGTDWFRGGYRYPVSYEVMAALVEDGLVDVDGGSGYGEGGYGEGEYGG